MKTILFALILFTLSIGNAFSEDETSVSEPAFADLKVKIEKLESKLTQIETNQKSMLESQNKILAELEILKVRAHRG